MKKQEILIDADGVYAIESGEQIVIGRPQQSTIQRIELYPEQLMQIMYAAGWLVNYRELASAADALLTATENGVIQRYYFERLGRALRMARRDMDIMTRRVGRLEGDLPY